MSEPETFACIGCGTVNPSGAEVCSGCGHRFGWPAGGAPRGSRPIPISLAAGPEKSGSGGPASIGRKILFVGYGLTSIVLSLLAFGIAFFVTCTSLGGGFIGPGNESAPFWSLMVGIGAAVLTIVLMAFIWTQTSRARNSSKKRSD